MNATDFIEVIRNGQRQGAPYMFATLNFPVRGVKHVRLLINGAINGNPHDIWIEGQRSGKILGRAYLGSKKVPVDLEGWHERINVLSFQPHDH